VFFYEGQVVSIELPPAVVLEVKYTEPGVRGNTVQNVTKPATLETGLEVKVPNHINIGDKVRIDTRTGEFTERVNT
jgi:elongation factor P